MHVVVLGAGVVGATTAYSLAARGHSVTIIDKAAVAAAGCTHANGGQLSWSFTDSLAKPSFLPTLPGLLLGRDPASRIRLASDPPLIRWGLAFLRQCTPSRARANTVALLQTAMRSAAVLNTMRQRTGVHFAHRRSGKLVLLPPRANLGTARRVQ
jgi:D-amino-acid dehydrogenase